MMRQERDHSTQAAQQLEMARAAPTVSQDMEHSLSDFKSLLLRVASTDLSFTMPSSLLEALPADGIAVDPEQDGNGGQGKSGCSSDVGSHQENMVDRKHVRKKGSASEEKLSLVQPA